MKKATKAHQSPEARRHSTCAHTYGRPAPAAEVKPCPRLASNPAASSLFPPALQQQPEQLTQGSQLTAFQVKQKTNCLI